MIAHLSLLFHPCCSGLVRLLEAFGQAIEPRAPLATGKKSSAIVK